MRYFKNRYGRVFRSGPSGTYEINNGDPQNDDDEFDPDEFDRAEAATIDLMIDLMDC